MKISKVIFIIVLFVLLNSIEVFSGDNLNDSNKLSSMYHERIIEGNKKKALFFEDQQIIKMNIALYEIKPSETINTKKSEIRIEEGQKCTMQFVSGLNRKRSRIDFDKVKDMEMVNIYLTPEIVKGKGVKILIETSYTFADRKRSFKGNPVTKNNSIKTDIVKNYEEVSVELFRNKQLGKKIVISITPFIETIPAPAKYPGIPKYKLFSPILIMNDELISKSTKSPDFISAAASENDLATNCFIECIVKKDDKGSFLLSVKPFPGSRKIGIVNNKILKFEFRNDMYELISLEQILPLAGKWIIYGRYIPVTWIGEAKFDKHPFIRGKGGVMVVCLKDIRDYLPEFEDMRKYLKETVNLSDKGKYKEALKRHIWFHNHALEHEPSMYGVRLSFALSYWKQLGEVYTPALTALKKIRDDKTALLEKGKGDFDLFMDVSALNETLGEESKTVDLFKILDRKNNNLAKKCWEGAKRDIIKNKAYKLAGKYIKDFTEEFNKIKNLYKRKKEMSKARKMSEIFTRANTNSFVKEVLGIMEVAIALGKVKTAEKIQAEAIKVLDDPRLRRAFPNKKKGN